jgi:hypothetical protein
MPALSEWRTLSTHSSDVGNMFGLSGSQTVAVGLGAVLVLAVLVIFVRRQPDPVVRRIIAAGFMAKLIGITAYYRVIADVYGFGDVTRYVGAGRELAPLIRSGSLPENATEPGTHFTEFLTGVVFATFGSSEIIGYAVFGMFSFVGMAAFFRAFQLAMPRVNHRRYALLIFFLPTMVFWPSTIGKDAWMVMTLGLGSYGAVRVFTGARFGYSLLGASMVAAAAVRPHMAFLFMLSFGAAYLLRPASDHARRGLVVWLVGLVLVAGGVVLAASNFSEEMGSGESEGRLTVDRLREDTEEVLDHTEEHTRIGGSQYETRRVQGPVDFLYAFMTVPFRPFPHETTNTQSMVASLEGMLLLLLVVLSIPRFARLPRAALRSPYVALAAVYTGGFLIAFSNFGNFGLLARQRAQLMPLLILLLIVLWTKEQDEVEQTEQPTRFAHRPVLRFVPAASPHHGLETPEADTGDSDRDRVRPSGMGD